jgi:hypothetical protein
MKTIGSNHAGPYARATKDLRRRRSCAVHRENQTECVVVRKDVFERMKHVAYDDSEWTPEEMSTMAAHAFDSADTAGPIP